MARVLFLAFSGGGNLPPSLTIARELTARGHEVVFAGEPEMMPRMTSTPFRAIELTRAYEQLDEYPPHPVLGRWLCGLSSPAVEDQVRAVVDRENPDLVLMDFMFVAAQNLNYRQPTAALAHMPLFRVADAFRGLAQMCAGIRQQGGYPSLHDLDTLMNARDRVIVTSLEALDPVPADSPLKAKTRHVGPLLDTDAPVRPLDVKWDSLRATPVILVSFSTDPLQVNPDLIQRALDGLAHLDARVIVTVGGSVEIKDLARPPNAKIVAFANHDEVMKRASLVVTHGGHGTVMRALKYGVPMIVIPGIAPDQAVNGATIEQCGAGKMLPPDANFEQIRASAREMLVAADPRRAAAKDLSKHFADQSGAKGAADELEGLLVAGRSRAA